MWLAITKGLTAIAYSTIYITSSDAAISAYSDFPAITVEKSHVSPKKSLFLDPIFETASNN